MSDDGHRDDKNVILYPAGGAFNKLRPQQSFLECLLDENWKAYTTAAPHDKKVYVREHILARIHASGRVLKIFKGKHPDRGCLIEPMEDEALDRIAQKLRDTKKREKTRSVRAFATSKRNTKPRRKATIAASITPHEVAEGANDAMDIYWLNYCETSKPPEDSLLCLFVLLFSDSEDAYAEEEEEEPEEESTVHELKEVIWGQWEQIDSWRRLCASQKETIQELSMVNDHQHQMLVSSGLGFGFLDKERINHHPSAAAMDCNTGN